MNALLQCMFSLWCSAQQKYDFFRYRFCERRRSDTPVCEHSKGAVSLDDAPHHADLLRSEQLQRQSLARDQHHSRVWKHRDGLAAVVIMDCAPVKLLHVWAQVLRDTARTASTHAGSQWHDGAGGVASYSMGRGKAGVKGDGAGLVCLVTVSVLGLHIIFFLLAIVICRGTASSWRTDSLSSLSTNLASAEMEAAANVIPIKE